MLKANLQVELLKEKHSANQKLLVTVPFILIVFCLGMNWFMAPSPKGKSNLLVAAYNWYTLLILPAICSLLVNNILDKEKRVNKIFNRAAGLNLIQQVFAKNLVVVGELAGMLLGSGILIWLLGQFLQQTVFLTQVLIASATLLLGSLPLVELSLIIKNYVNGFAVVLINFIGGILGAIIAIKQWWFLFPWAYNLRLMAPILGIHPNGTFLNSSNYLLQNKIGWQTLAVAVLVSLFLTGIQWLLVKEREQYVEIN